MVKVSIVKCESYDNSEVKIALEKSLENLGFEFKKSQKILLKPNVLGAYSPEEAITTHPVIIEELVKILKKYDSKIYIGDSSAINTENSLKVSGIANLAKKYGLILINFSREKTTDYKVDTKVKTVSLPTLIKDVDLIINLPKLKTHALTNMTGAVKNLYGLIPGTKKTFYHMMFPNVNEFSDFIVEIYKNIKPELNIMDGVMGLEGLGPGKAGTTIKSKVILASSNSVALDIVAAEIIGFKENEVLTNKIAKEKNIFNETIEKIGETDLLIPFKKPNSSRSNSLVLVAAHVLPKPKIAFHKDKCIKCGKCGKNCPVKVISYHPYPKCHNKKCIKCFCCIEVCPVNAVYLKENLVFRVGRKFIKS